MLYPQGMKVNDIPVAAQLRLPAGFQTASSLHVMKAADNTIDYQMCSLLELADAPVVARRFMSSWLLSADGAHPVRLDVVADEAKGLTVSREQVEALRKTVKLTNEMFGSVLFRHPHLSEKVTLIGFLGDGAEVRSNELAGILKKSSHAPQRSRISPAIPES